MNSIRKSLGILALAFGAVATDAAAVYVTNNNDDGAGSLRQAIVAVNANCIPPASSGPFMPMLFGDTEITFAIDLVNPVTIQPLTELPALNCPGGSVNGTTQGVYVANSDTGGGDNAQLQVILNGSLCGASCNGLTFTNGGSVSGLSIHSFGASGVLVLSGSFNASSNFIGADPGARPFANGTGITIAGGYATIGGGVAARNLVMANRGAGISVAAGAGANINHNLIGGPTGNGNGGDGIVFASPNFDNVTSNHIRYNAGAGVRATSGNSIQILNNSIHGNNVSIAIPEPAIGAPTVTNVSYLNPDSAVTVDVVGPPGKAVKIEVFRNDVMPSIPEGQTPLATDTAFLDTSGRVSHVVNIIGEPANNVTATVTLDTCGDACYSSTSPFSAVYVPPSVPQASLNFTPFQIAIGSSGTLEINVANTNATQPLTGVGYSFFLPPGLDGSLSSVGSECFANGSGFTVSPGPNGVALTGLTLSPQSNCIITMTVSPTVSATFNFPAGYFTISSSAGTGSSFASTVRGYRPPDFQLLGASTATAGTPYNIRVLISKLSTDPAMSIYGATVTFPPNISLATSPNVSSGCGSGATTTSNASGIATLAGFNGQLGAAFTACIVTQANIVFPAAGTYTFTINPGDIATTSPSSFTNASPITLTVAVAAAPSAVISVSPSPVTFASTTTGSSATLSLAINNSGNAALNVSSFNLSGAPFSIPASPPCTTIAAGATCTLPVTFAPTAAGTFNGSLTINSNATQSTLAVSLSGTATAPPAPSVLLSSTNVGFGTQPVGTSSAAQSVTVTNNGNAPLNIASLSISGDFTSGGCGAGTIVAAGGACTINITFTPTAVGARTGTITIGSNAAGSPHAIALSGTGGAPLAPALSVSSSSVAFPAQVAGTTSAPISVTLTNSGTANLNISSIATSAPFALLPPSASSECSTPVMLIPGRSCSINITFTPPSINAFAGQVTITSDAPGGPQLIALSGNGTAAPAAGVSLSPASLAFGSQSIGAASAAQSVVVTNNGNASLSITGIGVTGAYTATGCTPPATLAAGASCTIQVTFKPTAIGSQPGQLTISSNAAGSPHAVTLSGTGVAAPAPTLTLSSSSVFFPAQPVGSTSAPINVVLTNTGNATLNILGLSSSGDFGYAGCGFPRALAPGASCNFAITFSPQVVGTQIGAIQIQSDAAGSPHSISLTGSGLSTAAPILQANPASVSFPVIRTGASSTAFVRVNNIGNAPAAISRIQVLGQYFSQTNDCPASLAAGVGCEVRVVYAPGAGGTHAGVLNIQSNASTTLLAVPLGGSSTAVPPPALATEGAIDFGQQVILTSTPHTLFLRNTGGENLSIASVQAIGVGFRTEGACGTLEPQQSCSINVVFEPPAIGIFSGRVDIVSNSALGVVQVQLVGEGVPVPKPAFETSVDGLGFGNQTVGTQSAALTVRITSTGRRPVNISAVQVSPQFVLAGNSCTGSIAPNASCDISVAFVPSSPGPIDGQLTISSDALDSRSVISLTGTGCRAFVIAGRPSISRLCSR